MDKYSVNPKDIIFSLDIGTRSIIGTVGVVKDKKFNVIAEKYIEHSERAMIDGQIHDIDKVVKEVRNLKRELEIQTGMELEEVSIAAAGRFLKTTTVTSEINLGSHKEVDKEIIRSLELTAVKEAEKSIAENKNDKLYCVGYSVKNYFLNGYVISSLLSHKGDNIAVEIIGTFLPRSVVDSLYSVMEKVNLKVSSLTLEPIAAMEAVVPRNFRLLNIALIDVGAGTSDIAISSNDTITAYGMVPQAGDEVTEAISKNYLVDFNTAEYIKKSCMCCEKIKYKDVLGMENEVESQQVIKVINPVVDKICTDVANKVTELNGGKSPSAVFLVGGGAYTPNFGSSICDKLQLPSQRIAIKDRNDVVDCVCPNKDLNAIGVTVLGIALVAIKKSGKDFIDVVLNDKVVSLFNAYKHKVKDVMIQAGINPKILIAKNGRNTRFTINDVPRVAFGKLAKKAYISVNGKEANIDTAVNEGDIIKIVFAKDGETACPKVYEYMKEINAVSFYINETMKNMEPVVFLQENRVNVDYEIKENDEINIIYPCTLGDYKKYFEHSEGTYLLNGNILDDTYVIKEGDKIYKEIPQNAVAVEEQEEKLSEVAATLEVQEEDVLSLDSQKDKALCPETQENKDSSLEVTVNGDKMELKGKDKYVFIDIFEYINFDLSISKGNIVLNLNGHKAGYYDQLSQGDIITIKWE